MKTKCKNCGTTIYIEKGDERICDDCWQYREELKIEAKIIADQVKKDTQKFIEQGFDEKEAYEMALMRI